MKETVRQKKRGVSPPPFPVPIPNYVVYVRCVSPVSSVSVPMHNPVLFGKRERERERESGGNGLVFVVCVLVRCAVVNCVAFGVGSSRSIYIYTVSLSPSLLKKSVVSVVVV